MGEEFTSQLKSLEIKKWQGPVDSGFGSHLVFIDAKTNEEPATFEQVKKKVTEDYLFEKQNTVKASILKEFEKKYKIEFDINSEKFPEEFVQKMQSKILAD
jgi:parvulin-like peptidyl-prolyl isomerase